MYLLYPNKCYLDRFPELTTVVSTDIRCANTFFRRRCAKTNLLVIRSPGLGRKVHFLESPEMLVVVVVDTEDFLQNASELGDICH